MKKLILVFGLLTASLLVSANSYSSPPKSELEQEMYDFGIVDDDAKYKDLKLAGSYFKNATELMSVSLPVKTNQDIEISSVLMTPYYSSYSYKMDHVLGKDEIRRISNDLLSAESVKSACEEIFNEKVYWVNGHTIDLNYIDASLTKVATIVLSRKTCS
jgi:hypothetical protein